MPSLKSVFIANLYLIGSLVIAGGFVWMFILAFVPQGFEMVIVAFAVTVGGIGFWGAAYIMGNKETKKKHEAASRQASEQAGAERQHEESTAIPAA